MRFFFIIWYRETKTAGSASVDSLQLHLQGIILWSRKTPAKFAFEIFVYVKFIFVSLIKRQSCELSATDIFTFFKNGPSEDTLNDRPLLLVVILALIFNFKVVLKCTSCDSFCGTNNKSI